MNNKKYEDFLKSGDTLRVYRGDSLVYSSKKDRLAGLMEYISKNGSSDEVTIMDKIMGNAAALLVVITGCKEVFSPLGSRLAQQTMEEHGITCHFDTTVPFITQANAVDMCPMEKLSLGKSPREFYALMKGKDSSE